MTIREMHILFRTLGQQHGLQTVRAILSDSIDAYLNDAIIEFTRKCIIDSVATLYQNKVIAGNSNFISTINGVRSLCKKTDVNLTRKDVGNVYNAIVKEITNVMFYTSFDVLYGDDQIFGCRFIERDKLRQTLFDYCNGASFEYPIVTMTNDDENNDTIDLYIGNSVIIPSELIINYVKLPQRVVHPNSNGITTECDIPEYAHNEIVEMAVSKFFQSIGATNQTVSAQ